MKIFICVSLALLMACSCTDAAPKGDLITSLPGVPHAPKFKQYSGYLDALDGNKFFYWFVESRRKPTSDPLILWLTGGPGCSSLLALLSENGPFGVQNDNKHLNYRNSSWNDFANVIYLESPAGVGFSYNPKKNYTWNDDAVADNNHAALRSFFKKFPEFTKNEFYLAGESYGGIYIPTLAVRLMNDSKINFKAFAVGNGLSDARLNDDSQIYFAYYHGIIGQKIWGALQKYCCAHGSCNFHNPTDSHCQKALTAARTVMNNDLNNYDIYADCDGCAPAKSIDSQGKVLLRYLHPELFPSKMHPSYGSDQLPVHVLAYLNMKAVQKAIHVAPHLPKWGGCSAAVGAHYTTTYNSAIKLYPKLLKKYRALVYNGDVDMVCNFMGDQMAVNSLNRKVVKPRQPWFYSDSNGKQIGGYVIRFDKIDFLTVRGAGHQVPTYRPKQAYQMIYNFINKKPYSTKVVP